MSAFKDSYTNTWACKFRYTNMQGETKQHKKTGFSTKKEADMYEKEFLDKLKESTGITFKSLYEYYIKDCEARLKPTTVKNKRIVMEKWINPFFQDLKIEDITPLKVRSWQTTMMNNKNHYSPVYLKGLNNHLSAILNFAVRVYGLKKNPCLTVGCMGKSKSRSMDFWTIEEFNQFIDVYSDNPKIQLAFYLLYFSGMRCGEMLALTFQDFNFFDNTVSITKSYARIDGKDLIQKPKTEQSIRTIPLPPFIMAMVKAYRSRLKGYQDTERLFPHTKWYFRDYLVKGCKLSKVKQIRIHDIRHSHATLLINNDVPIKQVSARLGHEDIKVTLNTYAHLYTEKESELTDKLQSIGIQNQLKVV